MKSTQRILTLACLATAFAGAPLARAQGQATAAAPVVVVDAPARSGGGPFINRSENELRSRKFFRGLANVTLAIFEVPNQAMQEAYRTSPVTGTVVGIGKGVVKGAKRFGVGLFEMATFYAPINRYQPYVEPEVVFMEHLH